MELQLQKQPAKFKPKSKVGAAGNKFVGVRQRPSGRWVAEIKDTTQKIRMWLGTFETAEDAARAYDEAACLLRGANTRTNFSARRPAAAAADSPLAARIRKLLHSKKAASGGHSGGVATAAGDSAGGSPASSLASSQDACFAGDLAAESTSCSSWAFDVMLDGIGLCEGVDLAAESSPAAEVSEFERMKVERQISASLYAMNGVQEYFEAVQDLSSSPSMLIDPVWDLPPLYHFY